MMLLSSSVLPIALLNFILLQSLSFVSAASDRSICVRQNAPMLAQAARCGHDNNLRNCLLAIPNFVTAEDLQRCFIDADCPIAEAVSEAAIILEGCDRSTVVPEVRQRGPNAIGAATPNAARRDRTSDASEPTSPAKATLATALGGTARPTACSTARAIETTVCPLTSIGRGDFSQLPCTTTTLTTMECAATNVCADTDDSIDDGDCIFRDNDLPISGIIVTAVLGLVFVGGTTTLLYFYALDRKKRRLAREKLEEEQRALRHKLVQDAADAQVKELAKAHMQRERYWRQREEARAWEKRKRTLDQPGQANPFANSSAASLVVP
ncbi:hypothetical protein F4808DRAFT_312060 [Astrocystis sublimbata]|nr:hypothetical protein F4808DRAFT_312060 [Astrocystis sublimbata]